MNFKNLSENLIITVVVFIIGGGVGYFASTLANKQTIELLKPTIEEAIRRETTKIENNLTNTFEKKSLKKGENINIIIDPTTKSVITNSDTSRVITVQKKRGFFKRIFQKK